MAENNSCLRCFAIGFALFSVPTSALASDWRYLGTGTTGTIVLVDIESVRELPEIRIRRPFPVMQIWVKMDHSKDKTVAYREQKVLWRYNCTDESGMIASYVTYGSSGRVLQSDSFEDYDFRYSPATPDTMKYAIMEFACGRASLP